MTRLRFVSGLILISLLLMNLPIAFAQSVTVTNEDWKTLMSEYQTLKQQWQTQSGIIKNLERTLIEASESQVTSQQKIDDLNRVLARALVRQASLESHILSLEEQLTDLGISLTDTLAELKANEGVHEQAIIDLVTEYEIKQGKLKSQRDTLFVVVIVETVLIGVGIYFGTR